MKLSLEEARKRATQTKLRVKEGTADIREAEGPRTIAFAYSTREGEEQVYNAALLAHCWNRFDEVVAALEDLAFDAARVERKFSEGRDWTEWRDLRDKLASAKDLLAKAKTVEMP